MKYSGIIFDFNGVLWWDKAIQEQAWCQFAEQQMGISLTDEVMRTEVHGRNNRHTLEYLTGSNLKHDEVRQLSEEKEMIYRDLCLVQGDEFKLSPGAEGLLETLVANKIPRAIATASGKENLDFFFEHLLLDQWFELSQIVYDDGSRPGKPAPETYLQAAMTLGLDSAKCVVVEDSLSGIQSAQSAGIGFIVAISSNDEAPESTPLDGVDQVIENLENLDWEKLFT
jgi:HAD superfamily hydrolase (TIGR01509 family)